MHPYTMKPTETFVLGPMLWMGCVGCEKLQRDFVARTFALIAPVQYVLQQVSCSYRTIRNAPTYYETHQNIGIGSNGVDWLHSLRKILTWLHATNCNGVDYVHSLQKIATWHRGTNFCINCASIGCFATSFMQLRNDPKCTQILRNRPKH